MTNASDSFFAGGQGLLYPLGSDAQWIGRPRGGMIISEPREEQQRDINTNEPLWWDREHTRPKTQLVFTVVCDGSGPAAQNGWRTDERVDAQDNGHRDVYVKGKDKTEAVKGQLAQHGRPGLRMGDHYYECWTGNRQGKQGQARTWAVMLFPGAGQAQQSFFGNEQQPQFPAAPQGFAPAPQPQAQNWGTPQGQPVPAAQGNAYGFGHQPPASPGGKAFQNAQQPSQPQAWAPAPTGAAPNPGPQPQFGQPPAGSGQFRPDDNGWQQQPQGFGAAQGVYPPANAPDPSGQFNQQAYAQQVVQGHPAPNGFGQPQSPAAPAQAPVPPVDNPWGQAAPAQNPYGG